MNYKPKAIIATPENDQIEKISKICNHCHIESTIVTDIEQLIASVKAQPFTMLIISDKITASNLCDQVHIIRKMSYDKYLPVIALCSQSFECSEKQLKPLLRAPFDILTLPVNSSILTCKIHLILTLSHQKQVIQVESKKTSRALSAKKAFLASISHSIRTPINSIIGLSDLLIGDRLDSEQTKHILGIRRSGEMLLALFNSTIDYSIIQAGALELESKVFEPIITIHKIISMLSSFLLSKRTELVTNIDSSIPRVLLGDQGRFEQILFNILFVCIQQTVNNSITLNIRIHSKLEDKIELYISVEDDSMDLNEIQSASLKEDSVEDINNIHIGLFVTKQLVQAMDGKIGFSVTKNHHSELWCTACFSKTSLNSNKASTVHRYTEVETIRSESLNPEDIRILLVEDSPINQIVEQKLLNKLGFTQIETVENGEEAVNILIKKDFDLVLMDILMPVMNGLEASRLIRRQNTTRNPNIPIIALTAQDTDHLQTDFFNYGINSYLSKPLNVEKISSAIKKCFPRLRFHSSDQKESQPAPLNRTVEPPKKSNVKKMPIFDKKALLERLDGDEALYQELVEGFMADIPIQINKIEKALDFDDMSIAGQLAHTMKGAFSNLGAQLLQNIAKDLEDDIQEKDTKSINDNIRLLKQTLNNVKKYI